MGNIHDDASDGTLTADLLQSYLLFDPSTIDTPGGRGSLTPLAAACRGGHLNVVRVLLDHKPNGAKPNALSITNRTPLFYATSHSPPKDRSAIVRALLDAGADVDFRFSYDGGNTPLMNAITEVRDKDVVHELVDHGASLTATNDQGETAETLAKRFGIEQELLPKDKRHSTLGAIIDLIVAIVMLVIAYTNNSQIKDAVNGAVKKLYDITGQMPADNTITTRIPEPNSVQELNTSVTNFVSDTGLKKFFPRDDPFLQNLAEKAARLKDDPTTDLGKPENIKRLTTLSLYQPVIYCDDSGSMAHGDRYEDQRALVTRIARIATKIVPDDLGVELCFINAGSSTNMTAAEIDTAITSVKPSSGTRIGTHLRSKILQPLVYDVLSDPGKTLKRPLLICVITDGCPTNESADSFKRAVVECRHTVMKAGYESTAVLFSISQIGDDKDATEFLDKLRQDTELEDVVHCTADRLDDAYKDLKQNEKKLELWLLKTLTNPIMGRGSD